VNDHKKATGVGIAVFSRGQLSPLADDSSGFAPKRR
jgi:hypothetical protein